MAMRDQIYEAIMAGNATKQSLLELTGTTEKGLASQFTYLRMIGTCPMKTEDGTYKIITQEEWAEKKASGGGGVASNLTPEQRLEKAEKRAGRATSAYDSAKKRAEANADDRLTELKFIKAQCELEISQIEVGKLEQIVFDSPSPEVEPEDSEIGEDSEINEPDGDDELE